jgi:hypothetical protein
VLSPLKILKRVPDGGSSEEFLAESMSTRRVLSPVNRHSGVWSPEVRIGNSFRYAFVIVVSLVVTIFDI